MAVRFQREWPTPVSQVLVVEDRPQTSDFIRRTLERAGLEVTVAATRERALELAELGSFDLIILDLDSSTFRGVELCRALGRDAASRNTPTLCVSGAGTSNVIKDEVWRAGAVDVISRPFQVLDFLARVLGSLRHQVRQTAEVLEWTVNR